MSLPAVRNIKNRKLNISDKNLNCVRVTNVSPVDPVALFGSYKPLMESKTISVRSSLKLTRAVNAKGWSLTFRFR